MAERLKNILEGLTWDIFSYVCLGLFEQHKLMFAFQITCKIMQQEGLLDPAEIDFFIKGKLSLDAAPQAKPAAWISDQVGTLNESSDPCCQGCQRAKIDNQIMRTSCIKCV